MERSGGGWVRKLSDACLHDNAIVARGILVTNIALWGTRTSSAPSILLVLLEPHTCLFNHSQHFALVDQKHIFLVINSNLNPFLINS